MNRLVSLYPRRWRDRYEAELLELLAQRPLSARDAIDLVRGALDAHVYPQTDPGTVPWTHRLPGIAVVATGLFWVAAWASALDDGGAEPDQYLGLAAVMILLGLPGDYMMAYGRRIAVGLGLVALSLVMMFSLPWELSLVIFFEVVTLILGGALTMAAIRSGVGITKRWILLIGTVLVPLAIGAAISAGVIVDVRTTELVVALLALPYGLAWAILGIRMIVRGAPTIIDPPASLGTGPIAREIPA